ncbi:hypothetical protein BKA61DRAFT_735557 [Leptodontidium sp. MPI-SDFR-AT-0119]|nr:hypothetical protein BKA61DRAFT_735557 [Leptodontidium sp. MPI-SDFR-AT-0119]
MFATWALRGEHILDKHTFTCQLCEKKFDSEKSLKKHKTENHRNTCKTCQKVLHSEEGLKTHILQKHSSGCSVCNLKFETNNDLSSHNSATHVNRCELCATPFARKDKESKRHEFHRIKCSMCFQSSEARDKHKAKEHAFICINCDQNFKTIVKLDEHKATAHGFKCFACNGSFETDLALADHHKKVHQFSCPKCEDNFDTFEDHVTTLKSMIKRFKCCLCDGLSFFTEETFNKHLEDMHPKKPVLTCDCCIGTFFLSEGAKTKHAALIHGDASAVACALCGDLAYAPEASSTGLHTIHEEPEPDFEPKVETWFCDYCPPGPIYTTQLGLLEHVLTTHPEKVHQWCDICPDIYFTTIPAYHHHLDTIHPRPKKSNTASTANTNGHHVNTVSASIACPHCANLEFTTPADLTYHLSQFHGFKCPFCLVKFESPMQTVQHIDVAHLLKCSFHDCDGAGFKSEDALKRHLARFHTSFEPVVQNGGDIGGLTSSGDVGASKTVDSVAEDEDLLIL